MPVFCTLGVLGGVIGSLFIKCNIFWCRFRKTTKLGQYPVLEVIIVVLVTSLLCFPNEYTRMSMSDLIYSMYEECGVTNQDELCEYYGRNFTNANQASNGIAEAGPGVSSV